METIVVFLSDAEVADLPDRFLQPPPIIVGSCERCGNCCRYIECPHMDPVTNLCSDYEHRPIACRMGPQNKDEIDIYTCGGYKRKKPNYPYPP